LNNPSKEAKAADSAGLIYMRRNNKCDTFLVRQCYLLIYSCAVMHWQLITIAPMFWFCVAVKYRMLV